MRKICIVCGKEVEAARLEVLPDTEFCIACARNVKTARVREPSRGHYTGLNFLEVSEGNELRGTYREV